MKLSKHRMSGWMALAVSMTVALTGCSLPWSSAPVEGVYQRDSVNEMDGKAAVYTMTFHGKANTYELTMKEDGAVSTLDSGTFSMKGLKIQTYSEAADENSRIYVQEKKAVFAEDDFFDGDVDDGSSLSTTCTYQGMNYKIELAFQSDGTFQKDVTDKDKKTVTTTGKYQRTGSEVILTDDKGQNAGTYYIYKHKLTENYYKLTDQNPSETTESGGV